MTRLDDEKEYIKGRLIKERPMKPNRNKTTDNYEDEIAVYGSDDDDVVTGDEMNMDGEYDQDMADANMDDEDDEMTFDDEDDMEGEDDLEGEDDEMSFDDEDNMEDDEMSFDDEDDDVELDSEDDMEGEEENPLDDASLIGQLRDVLKAIMQSDPEMSQVSDKELGEAVDLFLIHEEGNIGKYKSFMNDLVERKTLDISEISQIYHFTRDADPSGPLINAERINEKRLYKVLKTVVKHPSEKTIYQVIESISPDAKESTIDILKKHNLRIKRDFSDKLEALNSPELSNQEKVKEEKKIVSSVKRSFLVMEGRKLLDLISRSKTNTSLYVFGTDQIGESMSYIREDAKSLSAKTRKTHKVVTDTLPYSIDKILNAVLAVQFKGQIKPFTKIASDMKKANNTSGFKGSQAPARRGDKRGNGDKVAAKVEATKQILASLTEMSLSEIRSVAKALQKNSTPSKIISNTSYDFNEDFEAIRMAAETEGLSESFLNDTKVVFESAIKDKIDENAKALDVYYSRKINEAVNRQKENLTEQLDAYLDYVADQYMTENKLAIENGIRTEIAESLLSDVFQTFKRHNVMVPEGKQNLLDKALAEKEEAERLVKEATEKAIAYKRKAVKFMKEAVNAKYKEGLTIREQNELERKTQNIEFKNEQDYERKVKRLKEQFFSKPIVEKHSFINNNDYEDDGLIMESAIDATDNGTTMDKYVAITKKLNQKY